MIKNKHQLKKKNSLTAPVTIFLLLLLDIPPTPHSPPTPPVFSFGLLPFSGLPEPIPCILPAHTESLRLLSSLPQRLPPATSDLSILPLTCSLAPLWNVQRAMNATDLARCAFSKRGSTCRLLPPASTQIFPSAPFAREQNMDNTFLSPLHDVFTCSWLFLCVSSRVATDIVLAVAGTQLHSRIPVKNRLLVRCWSQWTKGKEQITFSLVAFIQLLNSETQCLRDWESIVMFTLLSLMSSVLLCNIHTHNG